MLYMLCAAVLALMASAFMLSMMSTIVSPKPVNNSVSLNKQILFALFMMIVTFAAISPPIYLIIEALLSLKNDVASMDNNSITIQIIALIASLLLCAGYIFIAKCGFIKMGAAGFIATVLLAFIYGNSLYFITGKNVGMANINVLRSMSSINDVECNSSYLLVKMSDSDNEPTAWRCPTNIAFMRNSSVPFIPYPDYTSGSSLQLSKALHNLMNNAKDPSKSQ